LQLEQVGLEIRALNGAEKQRWINRHKSYQAELKRILAELTATKSGGHAVTSSTSRDDYSREHEQLLDSGRGAQSTTSLLNCDQKQRLLSNVEKTEQSSRDLDRGYLALQETEEIGAKILADLDGQRDVLVRSQRKVNRCRFFSLFFLEASSSIFDDLNSESMMPIDY
jgi:vesicle transport through interaction with t-SNAREs protein 1